MKILVCLSILFSTALSANSQEISYIRFRHFGDETKPIGTLTICLKQTAAPLDSSLDSQFGSTVITNKFTYRNILRFINGSKEIVHKKRQLSFQNGTFEILIRDKLYGYLISDKSDSFFRALVYFLKDQKGDQKIIGLLSRYIDNAPQ